MSKTTNKFPAEVRARVVRMVLDHEREYSSRWAAVSSIAAKIGCTAQTLNESVKKAEMDDGSRPGIPSDVAEKMKAGGVALTDRSRGEACASIFSTRSTMRFHARS
jgi:transposase